MNRALQSSIRILPGLTLLGGLWGCDSELPSDYELEDDAVASEVGAPSLACGPGTHLVMPDAEIDGDASAPRCETDISCGTLDCGSGECLEEGGVAACVCPPGYGGDACEQCAVGFEDDEAGGCVRSEVEAQALDLVSENAVAASASEGHRVEFGDCGGGAGCADEIPMTGRVSAFFREVDIAMAQFLKTRCAGSGVVAVSRNGRRIYKRGFGKVAGSAAPNLAHCPEDAGNYEASAPNTLPDTPHQVGSVSKFVTAALVREQIEDRIVQQGLTWKYADASEALILDPDLELLPPGILRYLDQTRGDSVCPPITAGTCARSGCGGNGPDARWQQMTVGDLLGHTAGLASGVMPDWETGVIPEAGVLRGYDSKADWDADHAELRSRTKYPNELDAGRAYLAGKLGVSQNNVIFVSNYDAVDGEDLLDETLKITAGRCLSATPVGQTDSNPSGVDQGYQNGAYALLGRISAHLSGELGGDPRYASPSGFPELHEGSALDSFLVEHGLEDGVVAEHSLQSRVTGWSPGRTDPVPDRRAWDGNTYIPNVAAKNRPFCVWNGNDCDFGPWSNDTNNGVGLRLPWDFGFGYWSFEPGGLQFINAPHSIPFYYNTEARNPSTGGLMVEAPALLAISNLYRAEAEDVHQGTPRQGCTTCGGTSQKGGDMGGARARVRQISTGSANSRTITSSLPPRNGAGRLTTEPLTSNWTNATWTEPSGVDLVVALSQSADESNSNGYAMERYVSYGLSRVDWDAVDLELSRQSRRVVGMALNSSSRTYLWYADDHREAYLGQPDLLGNQATTPRAVSMPSSRIATDILDVAISSGGDVYAWYDDGHRSRGTSWNLDADDDVVDYSLPPGQTYEDIVGIAIAADDRVYSWYADGTRAIGRSWDLDYHGVGSYSLPPGQTAEEIVGIAIDWADDSHVYARFRDGSVTEGTSWNLDAYGYDRGNIAGMSMYGGDTTLWFSNGYMRRMAGSPADNMGVPTILESGEYGVAPGYEPEDVIAAAEIDDGGVRFWYSDGTTSWNTNPATNSTYPGWPSTQPGSLSGVGRTSDGTVYSWYNTGARAVGTFSNLGSEGIQSSYDAPQHHLNLAAVAIDSSGGDGRVWAIYRDGGVSRGRSWNLGQQVWDAP